jgi:hypothetical protein
MGSKKPKHRNSLPKREKPVKVESIFDQLIQKISDRTETGRGVAETPEAGLKSPVRR